MCGRASVYPNASLPKPYSAIATRPAYLPHLISTPISQHKPISVSSPITRRDSISASFPSLGSIYLSPYVHLLII